MPIRSMQHRPLQNPGVRPNTTFLRLRFCFSVNVNNIVAATVLLSESSEDAMFLWYQFLVSGEQVSGDRCLVTRTWAQNLDRVSWALS